MAFTARIVTVEELPKIMETLDPLDIGLVAAFPLAANMGQLREKAEVFAIFGPKSQAVSIGGNSLSLAGPFDKGGDEVYVIAAHVTQVEEINPTRTKIFTVDGKNQTVDEAVADVRQAIADAL